MQTRQLTIGKARLNSSIGTNVNLNRDYVDVVRPYGVSQIQSNT